MNKENIKWFTVKIINVIDVIGSAIPELVDKHFLENYRAYEESILLVKADSFEQAYEIAEKLAKQDQTEYINIYGQRVEKRYYEAIDCYSVGEERIKSGLEVYSTFVRSTTQVQPNEFVQTFFPVSTGKQYMLLNQEFNKK